MPRILLVEAKLDDRDLYAEYLQAHGYDVVTASTTDEAVPLIASADLLITGLMVPGDIFPIELIERARHAERGRSVPAIVVTASTLAPLQSAATAAGAERVLIKPCFPGDLLEAVDAALRGRRRTTAQ